MDGQKLLVVIGARGTTGREVVTQAVERGWKVRAVDPSWPASPEVSDGVEPRTADVLTDDLPAVFTGADAVISALGVGNDPKTLIDPPPLYTKGTLRIVQAMREAGVRRLVVISANFVASRNRGPLHFRVPAMAALGNVFREMAAMECILEASDGIDWTAVRPGWLYDAPRTSDYTVTPDVIPRDMIRTRHADLADFMLNCLEADEWVGRTPAIARREPPSASSPAAVLREMLPHGP